jgi:hypothetical protein
LIADFRLPISDFAKSAIGNWQSEIFLPARLNDARDLTLERQLAETDATQVELA